MSNRNSNITNYLLPHITKYRLSEEIGSGAYGVVYKGLREDDGKNVALKRIFVTDNDGNNNIPLSTHRELCALKKLNSYDNQNIVRLFDVVLNKIEGKMCMDLIFELGDYDLEKYLNKFNSAGDMPLSKLINLSKQLLDAIHFMHSYCVIHRDLKPANILINRDGTDLKITDFGLARTLGFDASLTPVVVTLWYRSPEILLQRSYLTACDVWSAGCIVAEMIYGRPVFAGENEISQIEKIVMRLGPEAIDNWPEDNMVDVNSLIKLIDKSRSLDCILKRVDRSMIRLVKKLLRFDPDQRILSNEALSELTDIESALTRQHQSVSISSTPGLTRCNGLPMDRVVQHASSAAGPVNTGHCNGDIDFDNEMIVHSVVRHVLDDDTDTEASDVVDIVSDGTSASEDSEERALPTKTVSWTASDRSTDVSRDASGCEETLTSQVAGCVPPGTISPGSTDSIAGYPRHLQVEIDGNIYCPGDIGTVANGNTVAASNDDRQYLHRHHDDYGGIYTSHEDDTDIEQDEDVHETDRQGVLVALTNNEATDSFSSYRSTNQCSISSYAASSGTGVGSAEDDEHDQEQPRSGLAVMRATSAHPEDEIDQIPDFQTGVVISDRPQAEPTAHSSNNTTDDDEEEDGDSDYGGHSPLTDEFVPGGRLKRVNSTPFKEINYISTDIHNSPDSLPNRVDPDPGNSCNTTTANNTRIIRRQGAMQARRKRILHPDYSSDGSDENDFELFQCSPIVSHRNRIPRTSMAGLTTSSTATETKASMVRRQKSLRRRVSLLGSHIPIDDDHDEHEREDPHIQCHNQASPFPHRHTGLLRAKSVLINPIPEIEEVRDMSFGEHSLARVLDTLGPTKMSDRPKIVVRRRSQFPGKN